MPKENTNGNTGSLKLHLLDMGREQYGDSILCVLDDRTILIDGGHPSDWPPREEYPSISEQLEAILGHPAPFSVDLLVVSHCHSDHIGCLPAAVAAGGLTARFALVADEQFGFGRLAGDAPGGPLTPAVRLAAALREEDHSRLPDDDVASFLEDAANLETRYGQMLSQLQANGTHLVRYGRDDHSAIESEFSAFGLKVLGPTQAHLQRCADVIAGLNASAGDLVSTVADAVDPRQLIDLYRRVTGAPDASVQEAQDRPGKGAALNDQSIVLKLEAGDVKVLLSGDMQFAKPEISGLAPAMKALRKTVRQAGPYQFVKLSHHASYNGFDDSLRQEWPDTHAYAVSGGIQDASHPDPGVLQLLEEHADTLQWARTDRNGHITVTFDGGAARFAISRGELSDPTPNADAPAAQPAARAAATAPQVTVKQSAGPLTELAATAKVSPDVTRLTVTFEIARSAAPPEPKPPRDPGLPRAAVVKPAVEAAGTGGAAVTPRLAGGRKLPRLLFLANRPRLENNIGAQEAAAALQLIRDAGQTVYEIKNPANPFAEVRRQLKGDFQGVVIVGGYDALPSQRVDALPPSLRASLGPHTTDDDNFIVWSDAVYGDKDGDGLGELPVSRIPDAKSRKLVFSALTAALPNPSQARFGCRNSARPFAEGPYTLLPGTAKMFVSAPETSGQLGAGKAGAPGVYFMLHGSDADATTFWGEDNGAMVEAIKIANVPMSFSGVVFTGCCWGALTVQTIASQAAPGQPLGVRTPGSSIALSYLHAGAAAFVGCTGTHYSPTVAPYDYFGGPMHRNFWKCYTQGESAAEALFHAKIAYLHDLPHGQTSTVGQAIEFKILKEYTCLGLGW
ncbi:MAG: MBL fold metallo-hydrolase [Acidobacteriia bacterium]|nr:MBL fold metallo-hydrolase [Terriglobia bacterium]